jgi:hypothetical protein
MGGYGDSYDLQDEIEAFNRQNLFSDPHNYSTYIEDTEKFAIRRYPNLKNRARDIRVKDLPLYKSGKMQDLNKKRIKHGICPAYIFNVK